LAKKLLIFASAWLAAIWQATKVEMFINLKTAKAQLGMSAKGQKRAHAAQQMGSLFDHLICAPYATNFFTSMTTARWLRCVITNGRSSSPSNANTA